MHIGHISVTEEEELGKIYDIRVLRRLGKYLRPYRLHIAIAALLSLLYSSAQLLLPYITKIGIDKYILLSDSQGLKGICALYFLVIVIGAGFSFGMMYLMQLVAQLTIRDIRVQTFAHLQRLRISFFDRNPVGRLVTRLTNDGETLNHFFAEVVVRVFTDVFCLIGVVIIMLRLDIKLSLIIFTVVPPLVFVINLFRIRVRIIYRKVRKWLAQINVRLNETFIGLKVIRLFNQEEANYKKFSDVNHYYYQANMQQIIIQGIFIPLTSLLLSCGTALIIWWGGGEVVRAALSLGTLVAFLQYVRMFFQPIEDIAQRFDLMQSSLAACERIFKLIDTQEFEPEIESPRTLKELKGAIEFKNVWLSYSEAMPQPKTDEPQAQRNLVWVLKDISFQIKPGERIAIVGPTGAGKTSLINLLTRFYEPQKGEILVDDVPIQSLERSFLRSNLAIVAQDDFIFSGTISENIRLRNAQIPDITVSTAARLVNAHQFIVRLPKGYNQDVKERGANLSSGELQLLTFARALAFSPKILILDEATKEVDSETENLIQNATLKLLENRTSLVIAHRLSTIKNVDRIIVLHQGRIIEQGSHEELLKKQGLYASLYHLQYK